MSRVPASVEDPGGVGDDPGVGNEPSVDIEADVVVVGTFVLVVLLLELRFEFQLSVLLFGFLLDVAPPVRAEGAGTHGEGDLEGGQARVEGQLTLLD